MSLLGKFKKQKVPASEVPLPGKLVKTRSRFRDGLLDLLLGRKEIEGDVFEELETLLLSADVGVATTRKILDRMQQSAGRSETADGERLFLRLRQELTGILQPCARPLELDTQHRPFVIMVVGVNGAGKTTTIGKLARHLQEAGLSVMLAAGDTFRAAAVEQLLAWGERNQVPVVAQASGADSASVVYDALQSAQAREIDVLIADTAGRLHTQSGLMEELKKVRRVLTKLDGSAPHEVLLVLDGGTGQNAISQTREFLQAVEVSGVAITKLDGTAKGGVVFALAGEFGLPIRFIGVGEQVEDLRVFDADDFVGALLGQEEVRS